MEFHFVLLRLLSFFFLFISYIWWRMTQCQSLPQTLRLADALHKGGTHVKTGSQSAVLSLAPVGTYTGVAYSAP